MLKWRAVTVDGWEATLGVREDGVLFSIQHMPTCHRRGPWRLLVEVCGGPCHAAWGCFDAQDQPMRYYHLHASALAEAEELARVLLAGRLSLAGVVPLRFDPQGVD